MFQMLHLRRKCPVPKVTPAETSFYLCYLQRGELSLDDWLKLLATQTCEMQNRRMYETLNQCVKAEAIKLAEYYEQLHEANFHVQIAGDEGTVRESAPTRITSISISSYRSTTPRSPTSSMSRRKSSASNSICACFWSSSYFSTTWKIPASSFSTPISPNQTTWAEGACPSAG